MNTHRNSSLIATRLCPILLLTILIAASARAQTPGAGNDNRDQTRRDAANVPKFRLSDLLASARPTKLAGFQVMRLSLNANPKVNTLNLTADSFPAVH